MANGHGGPRTPAKPAPVSGPGSLSRRTDGQPARYVSGLPYGEGQDLMNLQSQAPMAQAATPTPNTRQGSAPAMGAPLTPLGAPTERPDEPLTTGNDLGPGAGSGILTNTSARAASAADAEQLKGYLPALIQAANQPNVPRSFVKFVQYLRSI